MSTEWQLPPTYESGMNREYAIAKSLINRFADGAFDPPSGLVSSIENHLTDPDDAEAALELFTAQLNATLDAMEPHDDPSFQATLSIAIVVAWASSETESRLHAFLRLTRHSWWVAHLWVDVALVLANKDEIFKTKLIKMAKEHFYGAEKNLLEEYSVDPSNPITLDEIWYGHIRESRSDESSWRWVELLATLDPSQLFELMSSMKSLILLNRVLDSPEFYRNLDLWEQLTVETPACFQSNGCWNGGILLPSLIRHGHFKLIHVADGPDHPTGVLDQHVRSLLTRFVNTLAKRSDFEGVFKRWGTRLTRQHLNFRSSAPGLKRALESQDIFWALTEKVSPSFSQEISNHLDNSWDPWIYQSMLALLHSNKPEQFSPPDISNFINEWCLTPDEWDTTKGKQLRNHARHYHATEPNNYACRVLGYSIALSDEFRDHWVEMWNTSFALREILEFRPVYQISEEWRPSDASGLMRTLVDIGLGILDCTANDQEAVNPELLTKSAALFEVLWSATTEMLSIDIYGDDFWTLMQQHLAIRRIRWAAEAMDSIQVKYSDHLDNAASPSAHATLKLMSSDTRSIVSVLPLLLQNGIVRERLKHLVNKAEIDMPALAISAAKYQQAPERKFKIHPHHVSLIEELT